MTRIDIPQSDNPWIICSSGLCQIEGFELIPEDKLDELNSLFLGYLKREVQFAKLYEDNAHKPFLPVCEERAAPNLYKLARATFAVPTPERDANGREKVA